MHSSIRDSLRARWKVSQWEETSARSLTTRPKTVPLQLLDLPLELLEHVVSYLDQDPPSARYLYDEPSEEFFISDEKPLKSLSLTCRALHILVSPMLFQCLTFDIKKHETEFGEKIKALRQAPIRPSVLLRTGQELEFSLPKLPAGETRDVDIRTVASSITAALHPATLTVTGAPEQIGKLLDIQVDESPDWAYAIPFQILQVKRPVPRQSYRLDPSNGTDGPDSNLSALWTSFCYNQGSSIPVYSRYDYHMFPVPTWVTGEDGNHSVNPSIARKVREFASNLTEFTFVAVFPFAQIPYLLETLSRLPTMRSLIFRLTPSLGGATDSDLTDKRGVAHEDLWGEFESEYYDLRNICIEEGRLNFITKLQILDYANTMLHPLLDPIFTPLEQYGWRRVHIGTWAREEASPMPATHP